MNLATTLMTCAVRAEMDDLRRQIGALKVGFASRPTASLLY
jgi:hypothetical protein